MHMLGGHLTDALTVRVWEQTCLIKMAMLVASSAVMPDLSVESSFKSVLFLSLPWHFNFGRGLIIFLGHI